MVGCLILKYSLNRSKIVRAIKKELRKRLRNLSKSGTKELIKKLLNKRFILMFFVSRV